MISNKLFLIFVSFLFLQTKNINCIKLILHQTNCLPCITKAIKFAEKSNLLDNLQIVIVYENIADLEKTKEDLKLFSTLNSVKTIKKKKSIKINKTQIFSSQFGPTLYVKYNNFEKIYYVNQLDSI